MAQAYQHGFSLTADPQQAARFNVYQFGLYAGDQWRVRPNFTLTYGMRWDKPVFPGKADGEPGCRSHSTATARTSCRRRELVAARRLQLGSVGRRRRAAAARRHRYVQRPQPVRLPVEPVREHWHRVQAPDAELQRQQQLRVLVRPRQPAQERSAARRPTKSTSSIRTTSSRPSSAATWPTTATCRSDLVGNVELLFSEHGPATSITRNLNLRQIGTRLDGRPDYGPSSGATTPSQRGLSATPSCSGTPIRATAG